MIEPISAWRVNYNYFLVKITFCKLNSLFRKALKAERAGLAKRRREKGIRKQDPLGEGVSFNIDVIAVKFSNTYRAFLFS